METCILLRNFGWLRRVGHKFISHFCAYLQVHSIGGIAGSLVFRSQDAPTYHPGLYAGIACCIVSIIIVGLESLAFKAANAKADRGDYLIEGGEVSF